MSDNARVRWTLETLRTYRQQIMTLTQQYGVYDVRVFGSVVRGEAGPDSDIDLLVSVREGVSMFDLVALWQDLQDLLGTDVSLVTDDDIPGREHLLQRIRQDAEPL